MGFTRRKILKLAQDDDIYLIFSELEPKNTFAEFDHNDDQWPEYRERVLTDWIIRSPGTRPRVWWKLDAPEAIRARVSGPVSEDSDCNHRYHCGLPSGAHAVYESQAAYLKRLDLFLPGEKTRLTQDDFVDHTVQ